MEEKITFGKYILAKRQAAGLSQKNLAERLFVTESAVSKWERGISYPDITLIAPLAQELGVSEHELITASDDYQQKETERQAKGYRKIRFGYSLATYLLYAAIFIPVFIQDLLTPGRSRFFVLATALLLAFSVLNVPVLVRKNKGLWTLACFYGSLQLLLLAACRYVGGDWLLQAFLGSTFGLVCGFLPLLLRSFRLPPVLANAKGLLCLTADSVLLVLLVLAARDPGGSLQADLGVTAYGLSLFWALFFGIRYVPKGGFRRLSVCLAIGGAYTYLSNGVLRVILDRREFRLPHPDFSSWTPGNLNDNITLLVFLGCLAATGILVLVGQRREAQKATENQSQ